MHVKGVDERETHTFTSNAMSQLPEPKPPVDPPDPLKHFSGESARAKLAALFIMKLPRILAASGGVLAGVIGLLKVTGKL